MAPFDHFDVIAPYYDRIMKPTNVSRFASMLRLPTSGLVLDVGGGTGQKTHPLLKLAGGIVIADSSKGMLAQAGYKRGLLVVRSVSERLPFDDGSFARVVMVDALHHVFDYRLATSEMWRITKPGGRIIIEEPDIHSFPTKVMAVFEKVMLMRSHFISPERIRACFDAPNAQVSLETEDSTAWIIVDKPAG